MAPVTRRSGSSIRGEHVSHAGNKRLKHAMLPSAVASLRSAPVSRAYYQRKRDQGKPPWARPSPPRPTTAS
ncbi:transposase [Actinomyces naeslundii]|uniref:transposase n=1 Tax=Actinomyces naeslundii TaxID=1655 RepID=UPI003B987DA8